MITDTVRHGRTAALAVLAVLVASCGGGEQPPPEPTSGSELPELSTPATVEAPRTVLDIFPEDPARDLVLNNCASCHAVACAAMGQRTSARWGALQESHVEQVPALPVEELDRVFSYLRANFNDARPEPMIPSAFLEGGCTPF